MRPAEPASRQAIDQEQPSSRSSHVAISLLSSRFCFSGSVVLYPPATRNCTLFGRSSESAQRLAGAPNLQVKAGARSEVGIQRFRSTCTDGPSSVTGKLQAGISAMPRARLLLFRTEVVPTPQPSRLSFSLACIMYRCRSGVKAGETAHAGSFSRAQ